MSVGTTTNTMLNITSGLSLGSVYNFFVVSYGSEGSAVLPSDHSNTANVVLCEWIIYFRSSWNLYIIGNSNEYPSAVTVISTSYEGSSCISNDSNTATVTLCEWKINF